MCTIKGRKSHKVTKTSSHISYILPFHSIECKGSNGSTNTTADSLDIHLDGKDTTLHTTVMSNSSPNEKESPRKPLNGRGQHGGNMSAQQLRQRRARILKDKVTETQEQKQWLDISEQGNNRRNYYMTKVYMVVFTAVVVTVLAILHHTQPAFLFRRRPVPPTIFIATRYPRTVVLERDLPAFFRTYSIATQNNKHARKAAIKVANSRRALKFGTGTQKVILKAWDSTHVELLLERNACGRNFELAYRASSQERQDDLLMWCLLTTRIVEGYFLESVEMIGNAFILAKKRGMIVRKAKGRSAAIEEGSLVDHGTSRISNAYYLHPRLLEDTTSFMAPLPGMILQWLLEHPEDTLENPTISLEETIYTLISSEQSMTERYLILDEVCQESQPERAIGKQCTNNSEGICCYFVVPLMEGGHLAQKDDDEIATMQGRSLNDVLTEDSGAHEGSSRNS